MLFFSRNHSSRASTILSITFPMQLAKAMGLYEESSKGDFPGLSRATTRLHFQWLGTQPEIHVALYHDKRAFRPSLPRFRNTQYWTPSGPGADERREAERAASSSCIVNEMFRRSSVDCGVHLCKLGSAALGLSTTILQYASATSTSLWPRCRAKARKGYRCFGWHCRLLTTCHILERGLHGSNEEQNRLQRSLPSFSKWRRIFRWARRHSDKSAEAWVLRISSLRGVGCWPWQPGAHCPDYHWRPTGENSPPRLL